MNAAELRTTVERDGRDAAIELCRRRLAARPNDADTHRHLSQLLSARGEALAAQRSAMRACELAPDDARCWSDLGRVHARARDFELAVRCFGEAVGIDARYADGWHNLGLALSKLDRDDAAMNALKTSLQLDASLSASWVALGELLVKRGQDEDALECFDRAAACDPTLAHARSRLGDLCLERGRVARAETYFRQAVAIDPKHVEGWIGLARTLEDRGDAASARHAYGQALELRPGQGAALANYVNLLRGAEDADGADTAQRLQSARAALNRTDTPDELRALLGYALAKHHDRRGEHAVAAEAGRIANAARRRQHGPLDRASLCARVDGLISTYDAEFFDSRRRFGIGNDQPVFVVGMPRSGTTLTEQILSAHPQLHGAGELPDLAQLALRVLEANDIWRSAAVLDETRSHELAHAYLQALQANVPKGRRRISDKSPLNFFHLAFAAVLFPQARIVHCRRDPRDVALSIWLENFNFDQRYATDFGDLAFFISQYERLMEHWRSVLPLRIIDIQYEETVADVERQARRLIEFLGVSWDEGCLDFHRSDRAVQTPSRWQVRQPIYARSVGRWRTYAELLPDLTRTFACERVTVCKST